MSKPCSNGRVVVLDTETTGLDPNDGHRVVEVAGVEIINRQLTGRHLHLYVNPERDSDPEALRVHGLTTAFLSEHPLFTEIAHSVVEFVRDAEVIIHNAPFDTAFLDAELARAGLSAFDSYCGQITDSLVHARELHPGKRNSLDALCERYEVSNAHRVLHGALLDSELLADVWLAMTRGQNALAMDFSQSTAGQARGLQASAADLSGLRVIQADATELAEHEAYLQTLEQVAGAPPLWRQLEQT